MNLVLFKRSLVNEVRSFCLQKHNLLRDLRSTIWQTYNLWIVCRGFAVHGLLYGKSLKGLFRREIKKCTELEPRISMERGKPVNTFLWTEFSILDQWSDFRPKSY